jgi:hypothetical protein
MDSRLESELREAGEELAENHDSAVIADVIGEVEHLDSESSDATAEVLRTMVEDHI